MECDRRYATGRTDNGELLRCPIDHHFRHPNETPNDQFHGAGEGQHWRGNAGIEHYHRPPAPPGDHQPNSSASNRRNFVLHQPLCERWSATLHLVDYGGTTASRPRAGQRLEWWDHHQRYSHCERDIYVYRDCNGQQRRTSLPAVQHHGNLIGCVGHQLPIQICIQG
jgi:hypothetical protein